MEQKDNINRGTILLNKFYDGQTSREEEVELYVMLTEGQLSHLSKSDQLLLKLSLESDMPQTSSYSASDEDLAFVEQLKTIASPQTRTEKDNGLRRRLWVYSSVIAASICLLLICAFSYRYYAHHEDADTNIPSNINGKYISQSQVNHLAENYLSLVNAHLRQGNEAIEQTTEAFNRINEQ